MDLGGGLGISYLPSDDPPPLDESRRQAARTSSQTEIGPRRAARLPTIAVEPGRAIAGPGTVTLYEVGTIKDVALDGGAARRYVSVDGGMSDNIRTALYQADYDCRAGLARSSDAQAVVARVVGKHCESGDIVIRDAWMPDDVAPGDLLAVAATGAYCYSMSSRYNLFTTPGGGRGARRIRAPVASPGNVEDLLSLEVNQ